MKIIVFSLLFLLSFLNSFTQKKLGLSESILNARNSLAPENLRGLQFIKNTTDYIYLNSNSEWVRGNEKQERVFLTLNDINTKLKANSIDEIKTMPNISFSSDKYQFTHKNKNISILNNGSVVIEDPKPQLSKTNAELSTAGYIAYLENNNLFVFDGLKDKQITKDGSENIVYGSSVHREEWGIEKGLFWSNSGKLLAFYRMDQTLVSDYPIIDYSKNPATVSKIKYPFAGGTNHIVKVGIYNPLLNSTLYLKTGEIDQYLTNISWSPDDKSIYVAQVNRAQNAVKLCQYNAYTGELLRTLFEEKDDKYVEPLHPIIFIPGKTDEFIYQTRADGYNHLYHYDGKGKLIKQLTKGNWEVIDVKGFDETGNNLFFMHTNISPVSKNLSVVNIKTGAIKQITKTNEVHNIQISKNGKFVLDNFSSLNNPRTIELINVENGLRKKIFTASNPLKDYETAKLSIYTIKNTNGDSLYVRQYLPNNYSSTKKYPCIVYWYGGPHAQMITQSWNGGAGDYWFHYMASEGFIVLTVDTRGSLNRGKQFEQTIYRNLGAVQMDDLNTLINYAKQNLNIDENRMGLYGWSFGGFMTINYLTTYPNVFKAGVAGGPVTDWSLYEIMYGERYMDTPEENMDGYKNTNLNNKIQNLKDKLLLIHGIQDPVVVQQHSINLVRSAINKGVLVDYMIYPGHEHNVAGKDRLHLYQKITDYFLQHLK